MAETRNQANTRKPGVKPEPLMVSRFFPAPRALVFKAWSSAAHIRNWFSPEASTVPYATIDFRAGGVFEVCMRMPNGHDYWSKGHFIEIVPPERLVFTTDQPGPSGEVNFTATTTVDFELAPGGTLMKVHQAYEFFDDSALASIAGATEGWRTTLDRLGREIERIQSAETNTAIHDSFTLRRRYDASPAKVFHALTDQTAKARWFEDGEGYTVLARSMDVRPGGREHLKGKWTSGVVATFDAIYFDVVPDERLIYAYEMHLGDAKISVSLATLTLTPDGGGTRLTVTEQGTFLDGYGDDGSRERGTGFLLDRLGASLAA